MREFTHFVFKLFGFLVLSCSQCCFCIIHYFGTEQPMSQIEGILKCSFGLKQVLRYAMIFMFLVNTVCSIKNVNELLEEQLNMLISRVLIFRVSFLILLSLLLFVAFLAGEWGGWGWELFRCFAEKLHSSFFISIVFLKANLCILMTLFISAGVTQKRLYLILISWLSPSIFSDFPVYFWVHFLENLSYVNCLKTLFPLWNLDNLLDPVPFLLYFTIQHISWAWTIFFIKK